MAGLSLITYTHNDHGFMDDLISCVITFNMPLQEIVVVDDGSAVPYAPAPEARDWLNLQIIRLTHNRGAAQAKFSGFSAARGSILFSLDADIRPHIHWLKGALSLLEDPGVGLVGAACTPARKAGYLAAALYRTNRVPRAVMECSFTPGGCMLMRRDAWETIGGMRDFPAEARAFEDAHISVKMRNHGLRVLQDNRLPVYETRNLHRLAWCRRVARYDAPSIATILQKYGCAKYLEDLRPALDKALEYFKQTRDPILAYVFFLQQARIFQAIQEEDPALPGEVAGLPGLMELLAARPAVLTLLQEDLTALGAVMDQGGAVLPVWKDILRRTEASGALDALEQSWIARYREEDKAQSFDRHYTDEERRKAF